VGKWLAWKVVDVKSIKLGVDPWIGGGNDFMLSKDLQASLRSLDRTSLVDIKDKECPLF
jgi:hypothetical protein